MKDTFLLKVFLFHFLAIEVISRVYNLQLKPILCSTDIINPRLRLGRIKLSDKNPLFYSNNLLFHESIEKKPVSTH